MKILVQGSYCNYLASKYVVFMEKKMKTDNRCKKKNKKYFDIGTDMSMQQRNIVKHLLDILNH